MKIKIFLILTLLLMLTFTACSDTSTYNQDLASKMKVELYLPELKSYYSSAAEHWDEINLSKINLSDKPLLESKDIESIDQKGLKVKKNFIIVDGQGLDDGLIIGDSKEGVLRFKYNDKEYNIKGDSPELFYNYSIHGVCVAIENDNIFLIKQREFENSKENTETSTFKRTYKKGAVGLPYVLVVDGKRTELGILKVGDGEFAVPELFDSWSYMGFPEGLPNLIPEGDMLKKE